MLNIRSTACFQQLPYFVRRIPKVIINCVEPISIGIFYMCQSIDHQFYCIYFFKQTVEYIGQFNQIKIRFHLDSPSLPDYYSPYTGYCQ